LLEDNILTKIAGNFGKKLVRNSLFIFTFIVL